MKIKNIALSALLSLAVTSAFAQDSMMPSMEDQDYSGWKDTYRKLVSTPAGATSSMKMMSGMDMQFNDEYDYKVFKKLKMMASAESREPYRPFDMAQPIVSFDTKWTVIERKLNTYRRELIRENEARRMELNQMMGKPSSGM